MKSVSKYLHVFVLVVCIFVLVAGTAFSAEWKVPAKWKFIKFAGGSAAGSWTPTTAKICELVNKNIPGVNASSTLGASYSNVAKVNEGKMHMAFTQSDALADCYHGLGKMKGKASKDVRFLGALHYGVHYIFVPKNSKIKEVAEIAKRPVRMSVGPAGSGAYHLNGVLLKLFGSSYEDLEARGGTAHKVYFGVGAKMMKDGQVDFIAANSGINSSWVMDAATSPGIRFLELPPKERAQLLKLLPGSYKTVVPKDMFPGIEKDFHTQATSYVIFVNKEMPEELCYRITKVIWDNLPAVQSVGAFGKYMKLETAFGGMTIPLHPGAARYYKERGLTPPEPKLP